MISPPISACTFDAAGTLIHLAEPVGHSYHKVAKQHGIKCDPDLIDSAFRAVWKRTPPPFSPHSPYPHSNEKMWWRCLVREVFEEAGSSWSDSAIFDLCFEALYEYFESPGTWITNEDIHDILAPLSERLRCVVLSNFDHRLRRILRDLDLAKYFEGFFLSCEIGASKPDPRIFESARTHFDLPAAEILHIGDDPICDREGAQRAGFQFFSVEAGSENLSQLFDQLSLA